MTVIDPGADQSARQQALDPTRSFIIQAPAGSGKTELLVQRYLVLLTTVTSPEQIVALTFTKKACGEMRHRLQSALSLCHCTTIDSLPMHKRQSYMLALQVQTHARSKGWDFPTLISRCSILTIDACVQQWLNLAPLPYSNWAKYTLHPQPEYLYLSAIRALFAHLQQQPASQLTTSYRALLQLHHCDDNYVENLLLSALKTREQWLEPVFTASKQDDLCANMQNTIAHVQSWAIRMCQKNWPQDSFVACVNAWRDLAVCLADLGIGTDYDILFDALRQDADWEFLHWRVCAQWLLTQAGTWRTAWQSKHGFLAKAALKKLSKADADSLLDFMDIAKRALSDLAANPDLARKLHGLRLIPLAPDSAQEWQYLQPLLDLLPTAVAYLQVQMQQQQQTDFIALSMQLAQALQDESTQPALALTLYQQVRHLLVDEFQDTSPSQIAMLAPLLAHWDAAEPHTITVVGDPMQSIYAFRQADVRLFLHVQQHGIANVTLERLYLTANYRSAAELVAWNNYAFAAITAKSGLDYFYPAESTQDANADGLFWYQCEDDLHQAEQIVTIISQIRAQDPEATIAVLARARSHLPAVMSALKKASICYNALGMLRLHSIQALYDAMSVVLIHTNLHSRQYWLALLRSPFIGLDWADIHLLCQPEGSVIWENMAAKRTRLSAQAQTVLARVMPILSRYLATTSKGFPAQHARQCWTALGGPFTIVDVATRELVDQFFLAVDDLHAAGIQLDYQRCLAILTAATADETSHDSAAVQVMTVHKSKGLQFEHVICLALEKSCPVAEKPMLEIQDFIFPDYRGSLLHTYPKHQSRMSELQRYLRAHSQEQQLSEQDRLCYVAFTRAQLSLHMCAVYSDTKPAARSSWQAKVQPLLQHSPVQVSQYSMRTTTVCSGGEECITAASMSKRFALPTAWQHPYFDVATALKVGKKHSTATMGSDITLPSPDLAAAENASDLEWRSAQQGACFKPNYTGMDISARWGDIVHAFMYLLHLHGVDYATNAAAALPLLCHDFAMGEEQHETLLWLSQRLALLAESQRARWIFSKEHLQIMHEQSWLNDAGITLRVDRSFQCSDNVIWIVDFKTTAVSAHSAQIPKLSVADLAAYHGQLQRYQHIYAQHFNPLEIRCALYFPLQQYWHELSLPQTVLT